jgi:hypothetical protein
LSGLSKAFVGLLIVLSLLLSSAVIVWVNKTENYRAAADSAKESLERERKKSLDAANDAQAAKDALQVAMKTFNSQIEVLQTDVKAKDAEVSKIQVAMSELNSQVKQQTIALTSAAQALTASESQRKLQSDQLKQLREDAAQLVKDKTELNAALSDATNRLDGMTREWKYLKELQAEAQANVDKLTKQIKDMGGNPNVAVAGVKAGAPPINGVIREVRTLEDNRQWATISVGSADQVQKGMEFKVIDRTSGNFLGILTVQNVQPNEAVGVIVGPHIQDVKPGNEVRTQL